jgi:hypothetical protein
MHKFFFNVAAALLLAPLVTLAQGPPGPPQAPAGAPAGPDAVAATLVTTVCASCHTLDRVRAKAADRDAWTATVTRMKEKGTTLTDQQVPVIAEYLTRTAATLPAAPPGAGRGGPGGGRGGAGGRGGNNAFTAGGAGVVSAANLKVLTRENVEFTMQNITFALGLRCVDCHAVPDMAADSKPLKLKARTMLEMTRDINAKLGDGTRTHVTCWTCHRGSTTPEISRPITK